MAAHAFNADFWIAVATIAPILALANTVTITTVARNYLERADAEQKADVRRGREAKPINLYGWTRRYWLAYANYLLQTVVTISALVILQYRKAVLSPWIITVAIGVSLLLIAAQALYASTDSETTWRARR